MQKKHKVGFLSLGCPRNLVDSESLASRLSLRNFEIVDIPEAEIGIVNTCGFIADAKQESIDAILDLIALKKEGKLKKIIVYGCLVQRYKDDLIKELPEVDAFIGRIAPETGERAYSLTPRHYAYLKICEGCVSACSFCIIPKIKGRFASIEPKSIVKQVESFNRAGISELNIIGQDITSYGSDLPCRPRLSQLLKKIISKAGNIAWVRLLYLYPGRVSDDLLKLVRDEEKLCKYIDLPVQHINSRILKLMRRSSSRKEILELIERIRHIIPNVGLRTSLIIGFPSETDAEFDELLNFVREARFERLGAFIYSPEEGTEACQMPAQVPQRIKEDRLNAIMLAQQEISRQINSLLLGKTIEVLIDEKENDVCLGRSRHDAPEVDGMVYVHGGRKLRPGDIVKAEVIDTLEYDLVTKVS